MLLFSTNAVLSLLLLCLLQPVAAAAQEVATLTLVEGSLQVIRGTTVLRGAEGARLHLGDIIESSGSGFAQAEFTGGTVMALGGSTRLFLLSHAAGHTGGRAADKTRAVEVVLLSGWLKGETGANAGTYRYATPVLAAMTHDGTLVLHATRDTAEVFVESGLAGISEVSPEGNLGHMGDVKAGQFLTRRAGEKIAINTRPSASFIDSMPHPFRDTLPSRLSRVAGKPTEPKRDHEVSYSEIEPWLTMRPAWRKGFVERFQARLKDPEFRKAVEAHLSEHPEWDSVLHPASHVPEASPKGDNADSSDGRQSK